MHAATHITRTSADSVRHLLARALPYDVGGGGSLDDLLEGCACFAMADDTGRNVGAFSLECLTDKSGTVIHVTAAGGLPGHDLSSDMARFVEDLARQQVKARAVRAVTKRRALVKRLQMEGWAVAGFVLQKEIQ